MGRLWKQGLVNPVLMITKQGLELMIIFQVWLGKKISKNGKHKDKIKAKTKGKSIRRRPQREVFFKT